MQCLLTKIPLRLTQRPFAERAGMGKTVQTVILDALRIFYNSVQAVAAAFVRSSRSAFFGCASKRARGEVPFEAVGEPGASLPVHFAPVYLRPRLGRWRPLAGERNAALDHHPSSRALAARRRYVGENLA
jgi:hypothetical protein